MTRAAKHLLVLSLLILAVGGPSCAVAANQILNIRHWVAPDHTRVVIDADDDASYTVDKEERKVSVNLEGTSVPGQLRPQTRLNKPGLEAIAILPRGETGVRVELSLPPGVQTTVFKLKKFQDKPYRIVIDIVLPEIARQEKEAREKVKVTRKARVVVIDPGHGGEAVGAVGKGGTLEKDVVLAIGRKLRDTLNVRPGYRAFLTRDGDYYVSFKKRLAIAREYGADLFVSIHADAARNRAAGGSSVYCLSTGGASTVAAKMLARNENLADIVGGVANGDGADVSDPIILNMFQTHTLNQSRNFGANLLENIRGVNHLKFATVQEAPFLVLKLPEIPSVLIETAYISNPKEEKLLKSDRFQARIAETLARSIGECVPPYPPPAVALSFVKAGRQAENSQGERGKNKAGGQTKDAKNDESFQEDPVAAVLRQKQEPPVAVRGGDPPAVRDVPTPVANVQRTTPEQPAALNGSSDRAAGEAGRPKGEESFREVSLTSATRPMEEPTAAVKRDEAPPVGQTPAVPAVVRAMQEPPTAVKGREDKAGGGAKDLKREASIRKTPAPAVAHTKQEPPAAAKGGEAPPVREKSVLYRVQKGDTLDKIARRHGTSVALLVKLNGINPRASLYVDRVLKITGTPSPAPIAEKGPTRAKETKVPKKGSPEAKPGKAIYRVKKGDNLEVIARKHGTTAQVLAELNRLKLSAPLYVDRKLLLPENPSL